MDGGEQREAKVESLEKHSEQSLEEQAVVGVRCEEREQFDTYSGRSAAELGVDELAGARNNGVSRHHGDHASLGRRGTRAGIFRTGIHTGAGQSMGCLPQEGTLAAQHGQLACQITYRPTHPSRGPAEDGSGPGASCSE